MTLYQPKESIVTVALSYVVLMNVSVLGLAILANPKPKGRRVFAIVKDATTQMSKEANKQISLLP
jgi:hypothetical protein